MEIERITARELKTLLDGGEDVTIIDVRAGGAYGETRVAGARNIPKDAIISACRELPMDGRYVLY